ncbi:hypothetical protein C3E97_020640 [Pseudomonas sp. MWU12-2115]|uniref:hypothetical protein n=1 Tax=unclassified Pseudomonas TaxID=196821 RepID=UPI000CD4CF06|nr:hypothetical protein [Pseudomonas sp. MWU12-2020]RBB99680.1 hypothetical protein C3E97_020640 [Pseudomonas sp. MWU12-2115]
MRTIFAALIAVTALFSMSAQAAESSCKKISALAGEAMTARQKGELLEDSLDKIGDGSKFARGVVLKAYEKQVMITDTMKEEAVKEFRNEAYRVCLNANS